MTRRCSVEGCDSIEKARTYCGRHLWRFYKHGDPLGGGADRIWKDHHRRFWSKVDRPSPYSCWVWEGPVTQLGYGYIAIDDRKQGAHIFAWVERYGPVPEGLELDHLCSNPPCANPDHLEAVTHTENVRRGRARKVTRERAALRTHCKWGHDWVEENIYRSPKDGKGQCRVCTRLRARGVHPSQERASA